MLPIAGMKRIHRSPVAAVHIHGRTVHNKAEGTGILLGIPVRPFETHSAQTDLASITRKKLSIHVGQLRHSIIQHGGSGGTRPP